MFERGSFLGMLVSRPMTRWLAERCDRAEMTCGAVKAGLRGTFTVQFQLPLRMKSTQLAHEDGTEFEQRVRYLSTNKICISFQTPV